MMTDTSRIKTAIEDADRNGPLEFLEDLQGYSGKKLIGALQRLSQVCLDENRCYLEIGVYRGLTLVSVAKVAPAGTAMFGIDNFAFFDRDGMNERTVRESLRKYGLEEKATLINNDYEDALENLSSHIGNRKVGLYFVDGPHDYRSQLVCLEFARKHLAEGAVILVDDSNYQHVRQANRDFLVAHPEFKLIFESYTSSHPDNNPDKAEAREGWWDGINILVHDPANRLRTQYPPTLRNRAFYENEHTVHASRHGALAPYAHLMWESLRSFRCTEFLRQWVTYRREKKKLYRSGTLPKGKFLTLNTYSEGLKRWINPDL